MRIPPPITVTRPAGEIQVLAETYKQEQVPRVKKRMEFVLNRCDFIPVSETARVGRNGRNTPTRWVNRFNAEGIGGLYDRPRPGPTPKLPRDQVDQVVLSPPSGEGFKQELWTPVLLWHALKDNYGVEYSKGHLSRILRHLLDYRRIVPRTESISADPVKQAAWRETEGTDLVDNHYDNLWLEDETTCRVATIVKKVLAKKGSKPVMRVKVGAYSQKVNVFISWHPKTRRCVVNFEDSLDKVPTKRHLRQVRKAHGKGRIYMLWDGTGAHGDASVLRYGTKAGIHFRRFPTHSPKMNPVEYINRQLKEFLSRKIFANREELLAEVKRFFQEHQYRFTIDVTSLIGPIPAGSDAP